MRKKVLGCVVATCVVVTGCGGNGGGQGPANEQRGAVGEPVVATNESGGVGVDRRGAEAPSRGVLEGGPSVDELDQIGAPDEEALAQGAGSCGAVRAAPTAGTVPEASQALVCLINVERTARGLRGLRLNPRLSAASLGHSEDMVRQRYFEHSTPGGTTMLDRLKQVRYVTPAGAFIVGENLAWGSGDLSSPKKLVDAWMNSPPHRANILQPRFREVGVGIAVGAPLADVTGDAVTVTTDFGRTSRASASRSRR